MDWVGILVIVEALAIGALVGWIVMTRWFQPESKIALSEAVAEVALSEEEAKAIDPANPPRYMVYRPREYDPSRALRCSCHQRRIEVGERVLLWPIPNHPEGAMDIFCAATYGAVQ